MLLGKISLAHLRLLRDPQGMTSPTLPPLEELLTVDEVAKLTRQSPRTIRRLIARGEIPIVRPVPGSVRIAPADLRAYLEERREE